MNTVNIGDTAPLWELEDQDEHPVNVRDFIGKKNVVLSFHPLAWTPVCSQQMKELDAAAAELAQNDAVAFGISVDPAPSKKAWADALGIRAIRLPSDFWPHGKVARAYGIFIERFGYSERAVFIVNKEGKIAFKKIYPAKELPAIAEIVNEVKKLAAVPA